jgi:hypothetical protein
MKIASTLVLVLFLGGCAGFKAQVGEDILRVMDAGRAEFCGGTFPLASYEAFLRDHGKTWADFTEWCSRALGTDL